jgi:hypothetical protein
MRTLEQIDITKAIDKEEFCMIFEMQLPLNNEEKMKLRNEYFSFYALCVTSGVEPAMAFEATKNLFYSQETQIKERICSPENSLNG